MYISYQSPVSIGNQPHTPLGQSNLESSPLAIDHPPQSPVSRSSNPVSSFSYVDSISIITPAFNGNQPHPSTGQTTHLLQVEPPISQSPIRKTDIRRCCRFVTNDIKLLAGLIGVTDHELADIQHNFSMKNICALRLIEKWMQNNPEPNKDDLYQLLVDADQFDAAKSLVSSSYINYRNCNWVWKNRAYCS